jgi:hypothetical protein
MAKLVRLFFFSLVVVGLALSFTAPLPLTAQTPVVPEPTNEPGTIEIDVPEVAEGVVDVTTTVVEGTADTINNFLDRLINTPRSDVARLLLVVGGAILLIVGWRIYDFIILLAGFLIGASVGVSLVDPANTLLQIAGLLIGGVIGLVLAALLYYVAIFFIGAYLGVALTSAAAVALELTPVSPLVLLVMAIVGGLLMLALSFEFLVLLSALVGAQMLSLGLGLGPLWTLVLFIVGVIIQLVATRYSGRVIRRRPARVFYWPRRRTL